MCRLFAQVSSSPASAVEHLLDSERSLFKQGGADPKNLQKDGWGIGHFAASGRAVIEKNPKPVFKDRPAFARAAGRARARIVVGHLRAASNPRGIAAKKLISKANTQPYTDGRWIFAHNGTLQIPDEVARELGPLARNIRSLNDSEVYFWQFMKFLKKTGGPAAAFKACIAEDWRLWAKCRKRHPDKQAPYTSLNAVAADARGAHVLCHASKPSPSRGVCNPAQPWYVMSHARREGKFLIGSENLDGGRWTRFKPSEILSVEIRNGELKTARQKVSLPSWVKK
ncbi:MAG TPA: class II glutamine amidotransferase [Elusimicrobiota bacterium]|nr:class II glutamine amidotransferase [Elusimicrobiota bacterium]